MNTFQIIMLAVSIFFAYKVYEHVMSLKDEDIPNQAGDQDEKNAPKLSLIDPAYLLKKADEAFKKNDISSAQSLLEEAHAKDSKNIEIVNKLAYIYVKNNQKDDALELYLKSLELNDQDDLIHNAIASLYKSMGDFESAKEHYERALEIDDEYAITYFNYANLYLEMQDLDKAKELYEKTLELDPDLVEAKEELSKLNAAKI
jgi:tetratricopeptide (TPR) repeat protein